MPLNKINYFPSFLKTCSEVYFLYARSRSTALEISPQTRLSWALCGHSGGREVGLIWLCTSNTIISYDATQRNSERYPHRQQIDMCTTRRTLLLHYVIFELAKHVTGCVIFANDIPTRC